MLRLIQNNLTSSGLDYLFSANPKGDLRMTWIPPFRLIINRSQKYVERKQLTSGPTVSELALYSTALSVESSVAIQAIIRILKLLSMVCSI